MNRQTPYTATDVLKTARQLMRQYKDARIYKHDRTLPYFQYTTERKDATNLITFAVMATEFSENRTLAELALLLKDTFKECGTPNMPTTMEIKKVLMREKKTSIHNGLQEIEIRARCMDKLFPQEGHAARPFRFYTEARNFIKRLIHTTMNSMRLTDTKTKNITTNNSNAEMETMIGF